MKLSQDNLEKAKQKLQRFTSQPCKCSCNEWILSDKVFEIREFHRVAITGSGIEVIPVITIQCKQCGHTHFFNAILLGLLEGND
jgi:predicted nucleic-acid-binding Zn-ribbon protein